MRPQSWISGPLLFTLVAGITVAAPVFAQQCPAVDIPAMMDQYLHAPSDPATSYRASTTGKNEHGQVIITGYGQDLDDMDSAIVRTARRMAMAKVANGAAGAPTAEQAKDMAAKI